MSFSCEINRTINIWRIFYFVQYPSSVWSECDNFYHDHRPNCSQYGPHCEKICFWIRQYGEQYYDNFVHHLVISDNILLYMTTIFLCNLVKISNIGTILYNILTILINNIVIIIDNSMVETDNKVDNIVTINIARLLSNMTTLLTMWLQ